MTEKERFDLVLHMGEALLANGGEIFRTTEMMNIAARKFRLEQFEPFIIANGIFVSAVVDGRIYTSQVKYIPLQAVRLGKVEDLNQLSRRISTGRLTDEQAARELESICSEPPPRPWVRILASGFATAAFCGLFGGGPVDIFFACLAGLLLYCFFEVSDVFFPMKKMMKNLLGSALVTLFCCCVWQLGFGSLDHMIIGSIFPLVPGMQLTTSVRNFMEDDYLAGLVRLTDAILVAGYIAIGVGSVVLVWHNFLGGIL